MGVSVSIKNTTVNGNVTVGTQSGVPTNRNTINVGVKNPDTSNVTVGTQPGVPTDTDLTNRTITPTSTGRIVRSGATSLVITGSSVAGSVTVIGPVNGGGSISINGGPVGRPKVVNQIFGNVTEVFAQTTDGNLQFTFHDSDNVKVEGAAQTEPSTSKGRLNLGDFDGVIYLPRSGVKVYAETTSGHISGQIASEGCLKTMSGKITLKLSGPIEITTKTMSGKSEVYDMLANGQNTFKPPSGEINGSLSLKTMSGDVTVNYSAS